MTRKMLAEERVLRKWTNKAVLAPRFYVTAFYRDIAALVRAVREDEGKAWMTAARNSHEHHRCNPFDPCDLCLTMNPDWKPAAKIRGKK